MISSPAIRTLMFSLMYTATKIPFMYSSSGIARMISSPAIGIQLFLVYIATKIPFMYSSSGNCAHDLQPCNQDSYTATKIPFMYSSTGNCTGCQERLWNQVPLMISSPAIRIFTLQGKSIYVFLFWELHGLPGEVVEPGTAHDLQPCNQDSYTATKIPFMYSSSGPCVGCQERSRNQVPCMISSPAIRIFTLQQKSNLCINLLEIASMISQPCNQDCLMYTATKTPFMCSSSGNCAGCQERSWNQVPRMISSPAIRIRTLQQKSHLCIPLLGIAWAARRGRGTRYRAWSPALQSGFFTLQQKSNLCINLLEIARMISQPCNQDCFNVHCNKNSIYVFLFWELRGLPGEVVEPGTAHDLQPCNQYTDVFFLM